MTGVLSKVDNLQLLAYVPTMPLEVNVMAHFAYLRVSTLDQAESGAGLAGGRYRHG